MKEKLLTIILCLAGLSAIFYGMTRDHDVIFITGLIFIIAGYLMIRKKIRKQPGNRDDQDIPPEISS